MRYEDLVAEKRDKLEQYIEKLFICNSRTNLTSFSGREELLEKGIESIFCGLPFVKGGTFVDIGSGSGIPAIPLALCGNADQWVLLEPARLKAYFLRECASELCIPAKVIESAAEEYFSGGAEMADGITVRGVKLRPRLMKLVRNSLKPEAPFLVWTGKEAGEYYEDELKKCRFSVVRRIEEGWGIFLAAVPCGTISCK